MLPHIGEAVSIDTGRIRLCPMKLDDAAQVHRLWTERPMLRWMWEAEYVALEQTLAVIERSIESFATRGAGLWCVYPAGDDTLIGFGGFWFLPDPPDPELVVGVSANQARRGFGREIVRTLAWHGLRALAYRRIVVDVRNHRGAALVGSLGFTFSNDLTIGGRVSHLYAVDRQSFRHEGALSRIVRGPQPLV